MRERSADIRSDLGQASNAGQRQNRRQPCGREAEVRLAAALARCSPLRGMRLARSLPIRTSASTRDPLQYFNSLLILFTLIFPWWHDAIVNCVCVKHRRNQVEEKEPDPKSRRSNCSQEDKNPGGDGACHPQETGQPVSFINVPQSRNYT